MHANAIYKMVKILLEATDEQHYRQMNRQIHVHCGTDAADRVRQFRSRRRRHIVVAMTDVPCNNRR